jgi:Uma2 family endonuclease
LYDKKNAYRRNGVQEYTVWQVLDQKLDWFVLREGEYCLQMVDDRGILRSEVFPGLWLAVSSLLAGDMATVLAVVQEGLQSPDHAALVQWVGKTP